MLTNSNHLRDERDIEGEAGQQGEPDAPGVTSAAERKRRQRAREAAERALLEPPPEAPPEPLVYVTDDWRLFCDVETLPQKAGCQPRHLRAVALKELVDNALDAGAGVELERDASGDWIITDDGPGLDPAAVPRLFSVNRPLHSSKLLRLPTRGMLGNGLRVVAGAVVALRGSLVVETRGHRLTLATSPQTGLTAVVTDEPIPMRGGVTVRIGLGDGTEESDGSFARASIAIASHGKPYQGPSSPLWYGPKDLAKLFAQVTPTSTTVRTLCRDFGCAVRDDRPAVSLDYYDVIETLINMGRISKAVAPEKLGAIGKGCFPKMTGYAAVYSVMPLPGSARIPYIVEAWASCEKSPVRGQGDVNIELLINRTLTTVQIPAWVSGGGLNVEGCGIAVHVPGPGTANYDVALSVITPYIQLTTDGKEPSLAEFKASIVQALKKACGKAYRAMERPARDTTIKDAAWAIMPEAYRIASGGGRYSANARQVMYAARPEILRLVGKDKLDDAYFTQTLLPDYINANPEICASWDVVFDARGHFNEPHTGREVALGTLDVRAYLRDSDMPMPEPEIALSGGWTFQTSGPKHRYSAVLFIEKEGFAPLLKQAQIAERFDIAIMSSKGMSTTAARELLDKLSPQVKTVLVMHDFDVAGFSIFGTLGGDNRRYQFQNSIPIVDIGLGLVDVEDMRLQSEPVETSGDWSRRSSTLMEHGATEDEIEYLQTQRVELNAMPADVFIKFLEGKLIEHGVRKVVPDSDTLETHARSVLERQMMQRILDESAEKVREASASADLPTDLMERVREIIRHDPAQSWDAAVAVVMEEADDE